MSDAAARRRKPVWLKVKAPEPRQYRATGALLDELDLHVSVQGHEVGVISGNPDEQVRIVLRMLMMFRPLRCMNWGMHSRWMISRAAAIRQR